MTIGSSQATAPSARPPFEVDPLRPLNVAMILLVCAVLTGGFLLLSAAESNTLIDGAVEWNADSPLRAVVQLLCLDYRFPTMNAGDAKGLVLGIGSGLALLALSVALMAGGVGAETVDARPSLSTSRRHQISPLVAAQILIVLYVLWSFASSRWSPAPRISVGGSILLGIGVLWSLGLSHGLSARAAAIAARGLMIVTGVTAIIAIWYYYGRNPTLRAKFPFGNPNFLSAALLPGALLAISLLSAASRRVLGARGGAEIFSTLLACLVLILTVWALTLCDSRGSNLALLAGLGAITFCILPPKQRWVLSILAVAAAAVGAWYFQQVMNDPSATGRGTTLRFRTYTWGYAWRMFVERPLTGYGQGGFSMLGDSYVGDDVFRDPPVFETRIDHAHCEWLEVMAELGVVGVLLIGSVIYLTLRTAVRRSADSNADRSIVVGLFGGFAALLVEESVGNGLRVCEVPVVFFTVLGLLWAVCRSGDPAPWVSQVITPKTRPALGVAGIIVAAAVLVVTQHDFHAARNAFQTDEFLQKGDDETAVRLASLATDRLSPQRVLINLFRLSNAQVIAAERMASRAADRDRRAREGATPNPRMQAMVVEDLQAMEAFCKDASHTLKSLVSASPGFLNHGHLEYRINMLLAQASGWRGDQEAAQAYFGNAAAALERELTRQPFDPATAADFVRLAGDRLDAGTALTVLARPLRYSRMTEACLQVILDPARGDSFVEAWGALFSEADKSESASEAWIPEKLRLAASADFARGDYPAAVEKLGRSTAMYASLKLNESFGAAAAYAELADGRFYSDPEHPDAAIVAASDATAQAPESRMGRELRAAVRQRMVHYHLAKGDEAEARNVLRQLAPPSVSDELVEQELGVRYRRLCESLLQRRDTSGLRKAPESLLPRLVQWSNRAIELAPRDPLARFVAADLAFSAQDDESVARHLSEGMRIGLEPVEVGRFLEMALSKRPDSAPLIALRQTLPTPQTPPPMP